MIAPHSHIYVYAILRCICVYTCSIIIMQNGIEVCMVRKRLSIRGHAIRCEQHVNILYIYIYIYIHICVHIYHIHTLHLPYINFKCPACVCLTSLAYGSRRLQASERCTIEASKCCTVIRMQAIKQQSSMKQVEILEAETSEMNCAWVGGKVRNLLLAFDAAFPYERVRDSVSIDVMRFLHDKFAATLSTVLINCNIFLIRYQSPPPPPPPPTHTHTHTPQSGQRHLLQLLQTSWTRPTRPSWSTKHSWTTMKNASMT